ncbi:hypothetical protein LguiA_014767 [Lonicera macranthoides]
MMNRSRTISSTDLCASTSAPYDDSALEGVAVNIKLLLKLIEDHKNACAKEKKDGRRMLRVAGMMTILDMVRSRIQKCQSFGLKTSEATELRRCNTDLRPRNTTKEKKVSDQPCDEKECLKKQINTSLAARKSLEVMCSSLGKEKEIMAVELARKAQEVNGMEDYINDLKAQNATLLEKVQEYAASDHKKKCNIVEEAEKQGIATLQERNKVLSDQLLWSLDGYRSIKRKLKEAQEDNQALRGVVEEMGVKVGDSLGRIRSFKQRVASGSEPVDIKGKILDLEHLFECFDRMLSKYRQRKGECVQLKGEINARKPSVLA